MDELQDAPREPFPRRTFLKLGAAGTAALAIGATSSLIVPELRRRGLLSPNGVFDAASTAMASAIYLEVFPTSPLIVSPFTDPLVIPPALKPIARDVYSSWANPPGPGDG